jgi:hypothetical protein
MCPLTPPLYSCRYADLIVTQVPLTTYLHSPSLCFSLDDSKYRVRKPRPSAMLRRSHDILDGNNNQ